MTEQARANRQCRIAGQVAIRHGLKVRLWLVRNWRLREAWQPRRRAS